MTLIVDEIDQPLDRVGVAGLSGDAVLTARGKAWHTPEIVDASSAAATRKRLEGLPVAHLLPGHGRPVHADETMWAEQRQTRK